ncbi:OprO/OprP family phosphate-selective porin [Craurococcus roseus]|uniref:OprO/OprP family phosphate-selective porin n=1 Tax=Craurococcus roseus TaxID=77585 RepID=A0ABP3Q6M5_9PROT
MSFHRERPGRRAAVAAWLSSALLAAGAGGAAAQRSASPDGFDWRGGEPTLTAFDGGFRLTPVLRLDADAVSFFGQDRPGGFRSGANLRRARVGAEGGIGGAFEYSFIWDFGGSDPNDWSSIYEAQVAYTGLGWGTVRLGAFKLRHLPEFSGSSFDLPFLERAAISNLAASVASGDTRVALGFETRGERWVGSLYVTDGVLSERNDGGQRGVAGRLAVLAVDRPGAQLQLGFNGAWRFETDGRGRASFGDYPELRVDSRQFLDTGPLRADAAHAVGPEVNAQLGPLVLEAVWQSLGVDAPAAGGGGDRRFEGWYVQGIHPLLGPGRRRDARTGVWARPGVSGEALDPAAGRFGALEIAGRYSTADLRDGSTRGGRQRVWSAALNWFPRDDLRITAQYANGTIDLNGRDRDFQAVGLRIAFNL